MRMLRCMRDVTPDVYRITNERIKGTTKVGELYQRKCREEGSIGTWKDMSCHEN